MIRYSPTGQVVALHLPTTTERRTEMKVYPEIETNITLLTAKNNAIKIAEVSLDEFVLASIPEEARNKIDEQKKHIENMKTEAFEIAATVKDQIIEIGKTVTVEGMASAIYVKGRTSWDSKLLEGLAIAIPELEKAKKVGNPSVRIKFLSAVEEAEKE